MYQTIVPETNSAFKSCKKKRKEHSFFKYQTKLNAQNTEFQKFQYIKVHQREKNFPSRKTENEVDLLLYVRFLIKCNQISKYDYR